MNIAFIETLGPNGITTTRATLTDLSREGAEESLIGPSEQMESFLYASTSGPPWPCGPSPEDWNYLCQAALADPRLRRAIEAALAASRHRFLATNAD
jgi:hypothetical protein